MIDARGRLGEIVGRAKAMGLKVLNPRALTNPTQGTGTEQALLDWDGSVIVLYELPVSAPPPVR